MDYILAELHCSFNYKGGSALIRGDRHKTSLLDGLAYDPEPLGAGAGAG